MKRLRSVVPLLAVLATPCAAQEPAAEPWPSVHVELRRLLEAYRDDLAAREKARLRELQVLRHLSRAAAALLSPQTDSALSEARHSLEEAMRVATPYPPLEDPVPDVLERAERVLRLDLPEPPEITRAKLIATVAALEDHVSRAGEEASGERDSLTSITDQMRGMASGLDRQSRLGIRALQEVRREVLRSE